MLFIPYYSIICFASYDDMKNVIRKLDGTELNGKRIRFFEVCFQHVATMYSIKKILKNI